MPATAAASQTASEPTTSFVPSERWKEAKEQYAQGLAFQKAGLIKEAVAKYEQATAGFVDCAEALNHFAWFLSAYPDASWRDGKRAVSLGLRAVAAARVQGQPRLIADCLDTLAVAYAEAGDFDNAVATATKAVETAQEGKWTSRVKEFSQRLALFKAHQAYHDSPATQPATQPASSPISGPA